jgi:small subunit ribosomal protein S4
MARDRDSKCRQCRREGIKLFLKGDRCMTEKCSIERRQYGPGQHGQKRRRRQTEYGLQLREKQKVRRIYGILENQFRISYRRAALMKGVTGANLLQILERRLDNVAYRVGFGRSRQDARQLVRHGHVCVNGRLVTIPSFTVREGDEVSIAEPSKKLSRVNESLEGVDRRGGVPEWLTLEKEKLASTVTTLPSREQVTMPIQEQLIVELYSK